MENTPTKKEIEDMIQKGINDYMVQKQFTISKIPSHGHTGIDGQQINENDLIPADQYHAPLVMGTAGSEVFTISRIPNFSLLTFYGVATNGAYGGGPYAEKAVITGEARAGTLYPIDTTVGTDFYSSGVSSGTFYQICNSSYTDTSVANKHFVTADYTSFAIVNNTGAAGGTVARAYISAISESSITITVTVTASWYITGSIYLS